jgi:hypothetical protein
VTLNKTTVTASTPQIKTHSKSVRPTTLRPSKISSSIISKFKNTTSIPLIKITYRNDSRSTILSTVKLNNTSSLSIPTKKKDAFSAVNTPTKVIKRKKIQSTVSSSEGISSLANTFKEDEDVLKRSQSDVLESSIARRRKSGLTTLSPIFDDKFSTSKVLEKLTTLRNKHRFDIDSKATKNFRNTRPTVIYSSQHRRITTERPLETTSPLLIIVENDSIYYDDKMEGKEKPDNASISVIMEEGGKFLLNTEENLKLETPVAPSKIAELKPNVKENFKEKIQLIHKLTEGIPIICRAGSQLGVRGKCRYITV